MSRVKRGEENSGEANPRQMRLLARRQPIYETAQEEIKSYILRNGLKPGDPLPPETELAQQFGISRNSLREAVKSLETLGVLEARTGVGLFVRGFSFDPLLENLAYGLRIGYKDFSDILEIRYHLEYSMAERAVQAVTPEQIAHLRTILERMRVAAETGRYSAEDDRAIHQTIWENVDNAILPRLLDIFWMIRAQAQQSDLILEPLEPVQTYQRHVSVVDALEQGNIAAFRTAIDISYEGIRKHTSGSTSTSLQAT